MRELTPEPLTAEAFAPFGSVIEASDAAVKLDINQGHAIRYDRLADVDVADGGGTPVISLFLPSIALTSTSVGHIDYVCPTGVQTTCP